MKYKFIKENQKTFKIELLCKQLAVSRSGYYAWLNRPDSQRMIENQRLIKTITEQFKSS